MDLKAEIREFLASRQARITPEQAGVPVYGSNRRVKGPRREEVAIARGDLPSEPRTTRSPRLGPASI